MAPWLRMSEGPPQALVDQSAAFAADLVALLNGTVCCDARLGSREEQAKDATWVSVVGDTSGTVAGDAFVPLGTTPEKRVPLWLRIGFRTTMDSHNRYIQVRRSAFGLCVSADTGRCLYRIEFDRDKSKFPSAHVHFDGASEALGYVAGVLETPIPSAQKLHVPVGGVRYRPTLEDLIEFLILEGLIRDVHADWPDRLNPSRDEFLRRQLKAAVRNDSETALEALRELGIIADDNQL